MKSVVSYPDTFLFYKENTIERERLRVSESVEISR